MRSVCRIALCVMAVTAASAAIQTAGPLLVDVKVSDLSGLSNNDKVSSWPCNGSVGGVFVPAVSGEGAVYQTSVAGVAAVTFAASANSVMTNTVLPPSSILGNNIWSAEVWVYNPTLENPEDLFSWTQRAGAGWGTDDAGSCMEIRYSSDSGNAVEHYGAPNIPWSGNPPTAGVWHHYAITRDSGGTERLYADGVLRTTKIPTPFNLRDNGAPFAMGGVMESGWTMLFSGSLAQVRVHPGTLSSAGVLNNYVEERAAYGVSTPPDSAWQGTSGLSLPWSDSANWVGGAVGQSGSRVFIDNGGTAVLTQSVGTVAVFQPTHGGLTMGADSALAVAAGNGALWLGSCGGSRFDLTMNAGTFDLQGGNTLAVGAQGGTGVVTLNGGLLIASGDIALGEGATGDGRLYLNGGQTFVNTIRAVTAGATNRVYFNGGTLLPRVSTGAFMQGLEAAYVQSGGAVFNVTGGVAVTVAQPLLTDLSSTGGGLKKFGAGTLTLSGANTFTGDILVDAGDLWFRNAAGLVAGYAGTITMTNAEATLGYEKAGGVADLVARLPAGSKGSILLFTANANDTVDFSAHADLALALSGSLTFTGTYIPYASHLVFDVTGTGNVYAPAIAGASSVEVNGSADSAIEFTGDSSYSGDTEINGCTLIMSHANALGNGSGAIKLSNGATLKLNADGISSTFAQRLTADSQGLILLGPACANLSLNLAGRPGLIVGTDQGTLNYGGTLTPAADTYRVGGGKTVFYMSGNQGLVLTNLTDASPSVSNKVVVESQGLVRLAAGNTYSGGTVISNNGALFLAEDGLGAVPSSPDPDNIYVDKGVIRSAGVTFSLAANRGLTVAAGGLELHPWSIGIMTVPGDLSGSGGIFTTDSGTVIFGGANNSWTGRLDIGTAANILVGTGSTFSWGRDAIIAGNNGTFGVNSDSDFAWSTAFASPLGSAGANLGFRKLGSGTLTVDAAPTYTQNTSIEAGTLKAGNAAAIPSGAGKGNINIAAGSQLDVNGYSVSVNGLTGSGLVSNSGGGSPALTAGLNDASATFSGSIDPDVLLVKSGAGTQTLGTGAALKNAQVEQGVLAMANPTSPTGAVTLAGSGILRVTGYGASAGETGLTGFFYDLTPVAANMVPLATLNAWLDPLTPALVASSLGAGAAFDFGSGLTCVFPPPYNSESRELFVARWIGRFNAETEGSYTFATQSDDGSMVYIDGNAVVNNNGDHAFDKATGSPVSLTAGLHDIVIAFYENGGGQGLTVFVTTPGGSEQPLPQSLLFPTLTPSRFSPLSGVAGTRLEIQKEAAAQVVTDQDATFGGAIVGANPPALFIKSGTGKLTLTSGASQFAGQTQVKAGTLALTGAGTLGPVDVAGVAALAVSNAPAVLPFPYATLSGTGLPGAYYDFNQGDQNYSMYNSQATLEAHLAGYTPNLIAGSDLAGANFDFGQNGNYFPGSYGTTPVFQVYWKGVIDIPTAGTYTFYTASDDGSMLFIDGVAVVNNNALQGGDPLPQKSGQVTLTAGTHAIAIAFYDHGGGWGLYAHIEGPGMAKQLIPNSMLHPANTALIGALSGEGPVSLVNNSAVLRIDEQVNSTYAGDAAGPAQSGIQKSGAQTLTLTGDNDAFLGTWSLLAGTLQVGDGSTYGTLGGSAVATAAGSSLVFNRSDAVDYPGAISGAGVIRSVGAGTVTLSGSLSSYNGAIQIAAGQNIALTHALAGSATATNNGTLSLTGTSFAGDGTRIGGSGTTLVQDGAKLTLANPAAFPNSVALEGGALAMPVTGETLSNLTVRAGATSELAMNVLASNQVWSIDRLTLEAGSLLQAGASYFGLYGKYYDMGLNNEMFETVEAFEIAIAGKPVQLLASSSLVGATFDFGDGSTSTLFPGKYQNNAVDFCVSWKGKIKIDVAGVYTFATTSDDQSMLFIDGTQVVKNNYWQGMTTRSGTIDLAVGLHDIRILFGEGTGGYGIDVDITVPGEASKRLPNAMLIPDPDDIPTYVVDAARLAVTNGPGTAAVAFAGDGTLRMKDLWFDAGAVLAVTGKVAVAGSALTVTVPQEVPFGAHLVADFTATPGLSLSGVTLSAVGTEGHLVYRDKRLYLVRSTGTLLLFR